MSGFIKGTDCGCSGCSDNPCSSCGIAIESVQCRSRSASKSKCGFAEYVPSTPARLYRTRSLSGTITTTQNTADDCTGDCAYNTIEEYSGSCTYDTDCSLTTSGAYRAREYYPSGSGQPCDTLDSDTTTPVCDASDGAPVGSVVDTATSRTYYGSGGAPGSSTCQTGSKAETLSDEFTTLVLHNATSAAVSAATWSAYGETCLTALTNYSTDEATITMRNVQWKFVFGDTVPSGYKLTFDIYKDGAFFGVSCAALPAGATGYEYELVHPSEPGELTLMNWAVVPGAC